MLGHEKRQLEFTNIQSLQGWLKGDLVPKNSIYYALSQANDVFRDDIRRGMFTDRSSLHSAESVNESLAATAL